MLGYPLIFRVLQKFDVPQLDDVPGEVEAQLSRLSLSNKIKAGQSVAITAGSRGIANIRHIMPALGSHGGGTVEGQRRIIESYGITEAFCGDVRSVLPWKPRSSVRPPRGFPSTSTSMHTLLITWWYAIELNRTRFSPEISKAA